MINEKGKFIYEKDGKIVETTICTFNIQGNLVQFIVEIKNKFISFIYNAKNNSWMYAYDKDEYGELLYDVFPHKVIRLEYTTIIA